MDITSHVHLYFYLFGWLLVCDDAANGLNLILSVWIVEFSFQFTPVQRFGFQ